MGECLIVRRGGESYELPVLSASYPKDVTVTAAAGASASFSVSITTPGRPAEYTYQWYRNGAAVSGGTAASLTLTGLTAAATYSVYCKVTNKAGSVNSRTATLTVRSYLPTYTYTGSHQLIDEGNFNWRLRLLTSGTLTFSLPVGSAGTQGAQAFLVGGGGGGGGFGAGGGGGYTKTAAVPTLSVGTGYSVVVGAGGAAGNGQGYNGPAGGNSTAFGAVSGRRPGRRGQLRSRAGTAAPAEAAVPLAPAARTAATAALEPAATPAAPAATARAAPRASSARPRARCIPAAAGVWTKSIPTTSRQTPATAETRTPITAKAGAAAS